MADEISQKRRKEKDEQESGSDSEVIGPLPIQNAKPKKRKGIDIFKRSELRL